MNEIDYSLFEHKFTDKMEFRSSFEKFKCFRVMDIEGEIEEKNKKWEALVDEKTLKKIYKNMVMINEADIIFNQAQRQSRISFYMTQLGEEASGVGSAAAVKDHDLIFPQYREAGAFLWRGFSI